MNATTFSIAEKKNKKKSLTTTILIHVGLLALGLIPFAMNQEIPNIVENPIVLVEFTPKQNSSSSASMGAPEEPKPQAPPATAPEEAKVETKPKPEPKPAPAKKPVLTTPDKKTPTPPKSTEKIIPKKEKPAPTPAPKVEAPKAKDKAPQKSPTTTPSNSKSKETKPAGKEGTNVGNSDKGKSNTGMDAGIFEGDGLLSRRVTFRADVKSLTKEPGKIVTNICVNREGRVTYAVYNKKDSTIKTKKLVKQAETTARNYRFERDYTVSDKQCGKLTFIFEL